MERGKPAPDLFLIAKKKLGDPPSEKCLVFEDAVNGIQAAKAAGMHCVWVPDKNMWELCEGLDHGAVDVVLSMEEFDPSKFALPGLVGQ